MSKKSNKKELKEKVSTEVSMQDMLVCTRTFKCEKTGKARKWTIIVAICQWWSEVSSNVPNLWCVDKNCLEMDEQYNIWTYLRKLCKTEQRYHITHGYNLLLT